MTEQEKQNIGNIIRRMAAVLKKLKDEAPVAEAIAIANREAEIENHARAKGIHTE